MKRCIFYTIIDPTKKSDKEGGGNQCQNMMIQNLKDCGYWVKVCTPSNYMEPSEGSLNVYSDIFNDPTGSKWFQQHQYDEMLSTDVSYLMMETAYTGATNTPYAAGKDEFYRYSRRFYVKAKSCVFLSPLHQEETERIIKQQLRNSYVWLPQINTDQFYQSGTEYRDIPYLAVGALNYWKGTQEVIRQYRDIQLIGYGGYSTYKGYLGHTSHDKLPSFYRRTQNFVHLPIWKEPFGLTVAEASLCGCNIISNENVGALSYGIDLGDPKHYKESRDKMIQHIKDVA
jgi:hypothetical protein